MVLERASQWIHNTRRIHNVFCEGQSISLSSAFQKSRSRQVYEALAWDGRNKRISLSSLHSKKTRSCQICEELAWDGRSKRIWPQEIFYKFTKASLDSNNQVTLKFPNDNCKYL